MRQAFIIFVLAVAACDPSYKLTGTVVSVAGKPIGGAKVESMCPSPPQPRGASDAAGNLKKDGDIGYFSDSCSIVVSAKGFKSETFRVAPNCRKRFWDGSCIHLELNAVLTPQESTVLRPGSALGPIRVGMSRKELTASGLDVDRRGENVGPFRVVLESDRVISVEAHLADLPGGLKIGDVVVPPNERDIAAVARQLSGCLPLQHVFGGSTIQCAGASVSAVGPTSALVVRVGSASSTPTEGP